MQRFMVGNWDVQQTVRLSHKSCVSWITFYFCLIAFETFGLGGPSADFLDSQISLHLVVGVIDILEKCVRFFCGLGVLRIKKDDSIKDIQQRNHC